MIYEFSLINRQEIAAGTMEFTFDTGGIDYTFKAGQNADFTLINPPQTDEEGNTRTFSLVSSPGEKQISIATRMRDTAFKNSLKDIPIGTKVKVTEAMGNFTLHKDANKPAVFLIGGIGITPIISMIRDASNKQLSHEMYLFYSNRDAGSITFRQELEELASQNHRFHLILTVTDEIPAAWHAETGRINDEMIQKYIKNITEPIFYSSGPPAMVKAMIELMEKMDIPEEHIRTEDFSGY